MNEMFHSFLRGSSHLRSEAQRTFNAFLTCLITSDRFFIARSSANSFLCFTISPSTDFSKTHLLTLSSFACEMRNSPASSAHARVCLVTTVRIYLLLSALCHSGTPQLQLVLAASSDQDTLIPSPMPCYEWVLMSLSQPFLEMALDQSKKTWAAFEWHLGQSSLLPVRPPVECLLQ